MLSRTTLATTRAIFKAEPSQYGNKRIWSSLIDLALILSWIGTITR